MAFFRSIVFRFLSVVSYYFRAVSVFQNPGKTVLKTSEKVQFSGKEREFLEFCAQTTNFEHDYTNGTRLPEISITHLQHVTLLGNSGALVLKDKVVIESVFDLRRLSLSFAWRMPAFMLPIQKRGIYTSIFHFPWAETSNYHWFFDCLPRLYVLAQIIKEPVRLVANANMPQFQIDTLNFVLKGLPNIEVEYIQKKEKWVCENFLLPSFTVHKGGGFLPKEIIAFLRVKMLKGYDIAPKNPGRRIYISRSKGIKRRIKNEALLLPVLEKHGFEVVFPETLSYRDQVQLFYDSSIIAGPHGAGFTNTFFARKAAVLELHPGDIVKTHYFLLSKSLDFEYYYIIGSHGDENLDFEIPVEDLERKLREILKKNY